MQKSYHLVATVGGLGVAISLTTAAYAIPPGQGKCLFPPGNPQQTISASATLVPLSNLKVGVNNGSKAGRALVHLSADICVDDLAEVRVAYSVDGGPPAVFGPTNFANHQQFCETRATMAIVPVPAGLHSITPYWRVSGASGKSATFVQGCLSAESTTK